MKRMAREHSTFKVEITRAYGFVEERMVVSNRYFRAIRLWAKGSIRMIKRWGNGYTCHQTNRRRLTMGFRKNRIVLVLDRKLTKTGNQSRLS